LEISTAMFSSFSCRGVLTLATELRSSMILPPVVLAPTAVIRMRAKPSVTSEPAKSEGFSTLFLKGSLSPVSADSSITRFCPVCRKTVRNEVRDERDKQSQTTRKGLQQRA
jgi:hypothetical protein